MKGYQKLILTILIIAAGADIASGQNIRTYDVTSGLSANTIKYILQDSNGYIWCATSDGLNVFNGTTFRSYGCSYHSPGKDGITALNALSLLQHKDGQKIWVSTQSSDLLLFDPKTETFESIELAKRSDILPPPNLCFSLAYDTNGQLWIATDSGIFVYDEDTDKCKIWSKANSNLQSDIIQCVFCDSYGTIWIGGESGLYRFNATKEEFIPAKVDTKTFPKDGSLHIATITEGSGEHLWIGTWTNGLAYYNRSDNILSWIGQDVPSAKSGKMRVRSILAENSETLWICSNIGLFRHDILHNRTSQVILSTLKTDDNVYSCMKDKEGGIWFGTYFNGLHYLSPKARQIECYTNRNIPKKLNGSAISSFCEDEKGNIFIASENGGVSLFDPVSKRFLDSVPSAKVTGHNVHAICLDGQNLYTGTFSNGLKRINLTTGRVWSFTEDNCTALASNNVFSLHKSPDGPLYIGTSQGCAKYDPDRDVISEIEELSGAFIYDITEDTKGYLWFACYYTGLYKYDKANNIWKHYLHDPKAPQSICSNKILNTFIDDRGNLYICTEGGGVCKYDYTTDSFLPFRLTKDGVDVSLAIVYGMQNDANGNLWLSSNNGIWICDINGEIIRHLTQEDGLQSNQYNFGATFRSSTGKLFFGGINGFNVFNSEKIEDNTILPVVTARINYKDNDGSDFTSDRITKTGTIKIPRTVSTFSIDFECLSYTAPHKHRFAYSIDDNAETIFTSEPSVTLMNFPHGKHTINVTACNGDGYWSDEEVVLTINNQPPVLKSTGAKLMYVILVITILFFVTRAMEKRRNEKARIKLNEIKAIQEQEAYTAKINFFTHVAHEIKTPVTLIKAPLEVILKNEQNEDNKKNLDIIEKNTSRLLNLVNQLLDFKKISNTGYDIITEASRPAVLIHEVVNRFNGATPGQISFTTDIPDDSISCMLDPEAYTKIISNLMANAVKHTRSRIDIKLCICESYNGQMLHLEVKDDGCGIAEQYQEVIFDTFYQINTSENPRMSGVGLGLSLVKLLVQKHNGSVYVDNDYKDGCCICVDIPYLTAQQTASSESEEDKDSCRINMLIVEDTADMLEFISTVFKESNAIFKASNGAEALEILKHHDIDVIISDISMPVMNGFEMLQQIRKSDLFCHIPVIMLTVENSLETRIKGLEYGADAYIEKPFSTKHLKATVDNLITRRETLRKRFIDNPLKQEAESILSDRDKEWFAHVTELINSNIQEPEISIDSLAQDLNLSRSSFQRKIKGLTGLSPVEFIRLIRLKKAAELLSTGNYRINEVSYMVGFNKPSYFSALFKKQFGVLPKEFISKEES